jgi:hypothetical protein
MYNNMSNVTRNHYEIDRDQYIDIAKSFKRQFEYTKFGVGITDLILCYINPYIVRANPYAPDKNTLMRLARAMEAGSINEKSQFYKVSLKCIGTIIEFLTPAVIITEPIPCAITTIGRIYNFNYNQKELYDNAKAGGNILSIGNQSGFIIADGEDDPRQQPMKNKQGRPSKKTKCHLFGTSQTTFRVRTPLRANKIFCVKVFQSNVSFETLGGLFVDCRDTRDVNNIVLCEIKRALKRPDLIIEDFHATMRNYRCQLTGGYNICVGKIQEVVDELHETTHPNVSCSVNINRYPSAIIEIKVENHTSKKKKIVAKIFQSGKLNIDSCVFYEHLFDTYRFLNWMFLTYADRLLYIPPTPDIEEDSDYYYEQEGVIRPPDILI